MTLENGTMAHVLGESMLAGIQGECKRTGTFNAQLKLRTAALASKPLETAESVWVLHNLRELSGTAYIVFLYSVLQRAEQTCHSSGKPLPDLCQERKYLLWVSTPPVLLHLLAETESAFFQTGMNTTFERPSQNLNNVFDLC